MTPADEELLTVYAFGEADPAQQRAAEALLAEDPAAADLVDQLRHLETDLQQAYAGEPPLLLDPYRHAAIASGGPGVLGGSKGPWLVLALLAGGTLTCVAILAAVLLSALDLDGTDAPRPGIGQTGEPEERLVFSRPVLDRAQGGAAGSGAGDNAGSDQRRPLRLVRISHNDPGLDQDLARDRALLAADDLDSLLPPDLSLRIAEAPEQIAAHRIGRDGTVLPPVLLLGGQAGWRPDQLGAQMVRLFLRSGGLLLCDPANAVARDALVATLRREVVPEAGPLQPIPAGHPLRFGLDPVVDLQGLHDGRRWVAVLLPSDRRDDPGLRLGSLLNANRIAAAGSVNEATDRE